MENLNFGRCLQMENLNGEIMVFKLDPDIGSTADEPLVNK